MSRPIRYGLADADLGRIHPQADGHLVMWSDYAALAAENERLRSASFVTAVPSEEYERLKAENERLRKAGDEMAEEIVDCYEGEGYDPIHSDSIKLWNAAKEGGAK